MIIFIVFIMGMSAGDMFPDESQKIINSQNDFIKSLNQSMNTSQTQSEIGFWGNIRGALGIDGIYDFIRNFFSMLVSFIVMLVQYLFFFIGISQILPTEFYVFFALICSGLSIAILKLIFLAGD